MASDLDLVSDGEIKSLYSRAERTAATRIYAAQQAGDEVRAAHLMRQAGIGPRDVILIVDRVRPVFQAAQVGWAGKMLAALDTDTISAKVYAEQGRISLADAHLMRRLGYISEATHHEAIRPAPARRQVEVPVARVGANDGEQVPLRPSVVPAPTPAQVPPVSAKVALPAHIREWTLPDGTDVTDKAIQRQTEAQIRAQFGPTWVAMWPRYPDTEDGVDAVIPVVDTRPSARTLALGPDAKPTDALRIAAEGERLGYGVLVEVDPVRRRAVFAQIPPGTRKVRDRLATVLKCQPHEVEVACHAVEDDGVKRLDQVFVLRSPATAMPTEKRLAVWQDLLFTFPGGSSGWEAIDDAVTGLVRLRFGKPRSLPTLVSTVDLLPDDYNPNRWGHLPFGVTPEGATAYIDMALGPHILVVGPSGTGKTIAMLQIATSALCVGYDLAVVDVAKRGADYKRLKPWTSAWARTNAEAAAVMKAAYAESQRRADIIDAYDEDHWSKLPPEVLEREKIRPLLVLVDEYQAFNEIEKIPQGMDKDSEEYAEMSAINEAKTAVVTAARRIVAEARWAGVYIVIGTQRAPADTIPVTMRDNCHWKIQLCAPGKAITPSTMGLTFPAEQATEAMDVKVELDDGASRGLALMGGDGGAVMGVRVGYAEKPLLAGWLEEREVPQPEPWKIEVATSQPKPGQRIDGPTGRAPKGVPAFPQPVPVEPIVEDLSGLEFTLDDLEDPQASSVAPTGLADFVDDDFEVIAPAAPVIDQDDEFPDLPSIRSAPKDDFDDLFGE